MGAAFKIPKDACGLLRHSSRKDCSRPLRSITHQVLYEMAEGDPEHSHSAGVFGIPL